MKLGLSPSGAVVGLGATADPAQAARADAPAGRADETFSSEPYHPPRNAA
jgi:hypothetical protein